MAKKVSFDNLPKKVEKILEVLTTEGSEHTALPELVQRVARLEGRFENLERLISPDRPTLDKATVLRILKIRATVLNELDESGVLMSHIEGRKIVYYEDDVVRFYINQTAWKAAKEAFSKPEPAEPASEKTATTVIDTEGDGNRRVDVNTACEITGRNPGAIYQLIKTKSIPNYKDGRKVYFIEEELREWIKTHPPRNYQRKADEN